MLCPRDANLAKAVRAKRQPTDFDLLSALKPTEGNRWAHTLCSAYAPEVVYTNATRLKAVEGISTVSTDKWEQVCPSNPSECMLTWQTCSLCQKQDGAVIYCTECLVPFHASCAWLSGHRFGFEFTLVSLHHFTGVSTDKYRQKRASERW